MTTTSGTSGTSSLLTDYISTATSALSSSSSSSTSSSSSSSLTSVTGDLTTFLKILTTQLQNQDPTNATDTDQFTQELVQFAGVEQQINTNTKLDSILTEIKSNGITPLISYIGQTVQASDSNQILVTVGSAKFAYTLSGDAASVSIAIKNSSGKTIATMTDTGDKGENLVSWNGKDSSGNTVSDGLYTASITAKDSDGKALTVSNIDLIGVVSGIETSGSTTMLSIGDASVSASNVHAVYAGTTTTSSSSTASSSSTSSTGSTSSTASSASTSSTTSSSATSS